MNAKQEDNNDEIKVILRFHSLNKSRFCAMHFFISFLRNNFKSSKRYHEYNAKRKEIFLIYFNLFKLPFCIL